MELRQSPQNQPELLLETPTDVEAAYCAVHGLESWYKVNQIYTASTLFSRNPGKNRKLKRKVNKLHSKVIQNADESILPIVISDRKEIGNIGQGARRLIWPKPFPLINARRGHLPKGYSFEPTYRQIRGKEPIGDTKFIRGAIEKLYYTIAEDSSFGFPSREVIKREQEKRQKRRGASTTMELAPAGNDIIGRVWPPRDEPTPDNSLPAYLIVPPLISGE